MAYLIHPVVTEVESLVRSKLSENGNAHLADSSRWVARVENDNLDYTITVRIFSEDAKPLVGLFGPDSGFEVLENGDYFLSEIPDEEGAVSLISLILDYSFAYTPTEVHDLELCSLRHSGNCMPWEVLSFLYFGNPLADVAVENPSGEGGDK